MPPIMYRLARAAIGCGNFFQLARAVVAQKEIGHWPHPPADLIRSGSSEMTDRLAQLESAFRAQNALIVEAQAEITRYLTKRDRVDGAYRSAYPSPRRPAATAAPAVGAQGARGKDSCGCCKSIAYGRHCLFK